MRRIMIIGSAGSGKSTLARNVGQALDLPVYHMDREVFWLPGWEERPKPDQVQQVKRIVAQEAWVFEGNNSSTFHLRVARAQMLVWLDPPLWKRLLRVIRRSLQQRGRSRPDMADGCTEQLRMLPGFLWFILSTARNSRAKQRAQYETTDLPRHRITTFAQADALVADLQKTTPPNRRQT